MKPPEPGGFFLFSFFFLNNEFSFLKKYRTNQILSLSFLFLSELWQFHLLRNLFTLLKLPRLWTQSYLQYSPNHRLFVSLVFVYLSVLNVTKFCFYFLLLCICFAFFSSTLSKILGHWLETSFLTHPFNVMLFKTLFLVHCTDFNMLCLFTLKLFI